MTGVIATATFAGGFALGIVVDQLIEKGKKDKIKNTKILLEKCYGEPMYAGFFSISEVREWVRVQFERTEFATRAAVLKINQDIFKKYNIEFDITAEIDNYLLLAVMGNESDKFLATALVKYEKIDEKLEKLLDQGNGILVINKT